jgi:uncharacterized protein (TIGR03435 family)
MKRAAAGINLALLFAGLAMSQAPPNPPAFDVADVQVSKARPGDEARGRIVNSRIDVSNATLKRMIIEAYSMGPDDVKGGPGWLDADRFDIVAKAPPNTKDAVLRQMLQTLLAERFKLVIHKEERVKQVYALTVGKSGPKFQESAADAKENCGSADGEPGMNHLKCTGFSMETLARFLPRGAPRWVDAPVVDLTELKGKYDFQLDWNARPQGSEPGAATDPGLISMFDAIQKLGLKLESRKMAMPIIVVDSVERTPAAQ